MAIGFVQAVSGHATSSTGITLPALTVAGGDGLVAIVTSSGGAGQVRGIADTQSNVWSKAVSDGNGATVEIEIWYALNCASGATTVTVSVSSAQNINAAVSEWSGMAASAALDLVGAAATGNSTAPVTGSITIANAVDLIVGGAAEASGPGVSGGPSNGFVSIVNVAQGPTLMAAYLAPNAAGSYATGWTTSTAHPWAGVLAAFKAGGATAISADAVSAADSGSAAMTAPQVTAGTAAARGAHSSAHAAIEAIANAASGCAHAVRAVGAATLNAAGLAGETRVSTSAEDLVAAGLAADTAASSSAVALAGSLTPPPPVIGIGIAVELADAISPIDVSLAAAASPIDVELARVMEL